MWQFTAKSILKLLVECLIDRGEKLDNTLKESHPNKTLEEHVDECGNLASEILEKLVAGDETKHFCLALCIAHDLGKLDPAWRLGERRLLHAKRSGELLERIEDKLLQLLNLPADYRELLRYSVIKHHSSLSPPDDSELRVKLRSFLKSIVRSQGMSSMVNIVDTIGVFKLADIVSASGMSQDLILQQYTWPGQLEDRITEGIREEAMRRRKSFDQDKYGLQNELASLALKHIVVAAPTGWGKTALSLLRAKHFKPNRILYILPTITAIRKFEDRLKKIFGPNFVGEYFYFADIEDLERRPEVEPIHLTVEFNRYFIPKVIITTIDQLLLATLQIGRYHLRRFNLRKSLWVLDEFHLLTPQMIGALEVVLEQLVKLYDISVLLMSASPSTLYINVLSGVLEKYGGIYVKKLDEEYRKLRRHEVKLLEMDLLDTIASKVKELSGKKVLIISNTVERAIEAYDYLREHERGCRVNLIHGRFTYQDRREREKEVENADILVSTQVAEVSLDISFNALITELAPLPSLIQRFGRVNRYATYTDCENIFICTDVRREPYSFTEFELTRAILPNLVKELSSKNEGIYLDFLDGYFRELLAEEGEKIERVSNLIREELERQHFFYAFKPSDRLFSEIMGRDLECLAIPRYYYEEVKQLKEGARREREIKERTKLLMQVKNYFVSVPYYVIKEDGEFDDDLDLYVVGNVKYIYEPERGLRKVS